MIHWTRLIIMPVTFWVVQGYTIHVHAIHTCYKSPTTHIHLSLSISFCFHFSVNFSWSDTRISANNNKYHKYSWGNECASHPFHICGSYGYTGSDRRVLLRYWGFTLSTTFPAPYFRALGLTLLDGLRLWLWMIRVQAMRMFLSVSHRVQFFVVSSSFLTWLCATFSSSSWLATGPSQNRLQTVSYLSQYLL